MTVIHLQAAHFLNVGRSDNRQLHIISECRTGISQPAHTYIQAKHPGRAVIKDIDLPWQTGHTAALLFIANEWVYRQHDRQQRKDREKNLHRDVTEALCR